MNEFQQVIKTYLDQRAQEDAHFAVNYAKKGKSIEKCCNYILRQAKKRGKRIETIEFDLRMGRVVQSRGRFNKLTDRHDDIVNLCNNNAKTILAARQP